MLPGKGSERVELKRPRQLRRERGLTQAQAARAAGMSLSAYRELERGRRKRPTARDVLPLALFYQVSLDYLLELTDERTPYA